MYLSFSYNSLVFLHFLVPVIYTNGIFTVSTMGYTKDPDRLGIIFGGGELGF
ncbi:hypothetical protein BDZ91DRAFT_750477, partial [Kalaharituber pfeilii]